MYVCRFRYARKARTVGVYVEEERLYVRGVGACVGNGGAGAPALGPGADLLLRKAPNSLG